MNLRIDISITHIRLLHSKILSIFAREEVLDVGGMVTDPRSGGVINLNPLLHKRYVIYITILALFAAWVA